MGSRLEGRAGAGERGGEVTRKESGSASPEKEDVREWSERGEMLGSNVDVVALVSGVVSSRKPVGKRLSWSNVGGAKDEPRVGLSCVVASTDDAAPRLVAASPEDRGGPKFASKAVRDPSDEVNGFPRYVLSKFVGYAKASVAGEQSVLVNIGNEE